MENSSVDKEKYTKLKRSIIIGLLIAVGIVGWHCFEYFYLERPEKDPETQLQHDIIKLTQKLYQEELKTNPYLKNVNKQGKTKPYHTDDRAPKHLLEVNHDYLLTNPDSTIALLKRLYDNYELDVSIPEKVTEVEQQEELDFLNAILKTTIMKHTMQFLHEKSLVAANHDAQLQLLKNIWFSHYSRGGGRIGSSGFEHVFLAELKDHKVLGLHNWIYFNEQEELGNLDYKGYIDEMEFGKGDQRLLAFRATFHNNVKPYNAILIGTSPELEMSLYTVCFMLIPGNVCPVELGKAKFDILTYVWNYQGKMFIASAYASLKSD